MFYIFSITSMKMTGLGEIMYITNGKSLLI